MEDNNYEPYYMTSPESNDYIENESNTIDVPLIKSLACIAIGWVGLSIVATIVSTIALLFIDDPTNLTPVQEANLVGWINFAAYAIIFISLFCVLGKKIIIKFLKQFKNLEKLGRGLMYGGILLGSSIAYNMIVLLIYPAFGANQNQNEVVNMITQMPVISFFSVVLFAPITEEITYRLCLTGTIAKKNKILGIVISSTLFGLIHSAFLNGSFLEMTSQEIINEIVALPSYIISGVVMAIAYTREDSIATSITAHMTNNFIAFVQAFIPVEELFRLF